MVSGGIAVSGDKLWYSTDGGKSWLSCGTAPFGSGVGVVEDIKYRNGRWVACGSNNTNADEQVWWSDNGRDWNLATSNPQVSTCYSVGFFNNLWVISGTASSGSNPLSYSSDGKAWENVSTSVTFDGESLYKVIPPPGPQGKWSAVGTTGGTAKAYQLVSTDGVMWTEVDVTDLFPTDGGFFLYAESGKSDGDVSNSNRAVGGGQASSETTVYCTDDYVNWYRGGSPFGTTSVQIHNIVWGVA